MTEWGEPPPPGAFDAALARHYAARLDGFAARFAGVDRRLVCGPGSVMDLCFDRLVAAGLPEVAYVLYVTAREGQKARLAVEREEGE